MMRWSAVPRGVAVWAGIVVAVVGYACTQLSGTVVVYPSSDWNTALPPGVDSSPGQFVSLFDTTRLGDSVHIRNRPGRCHLPCTVRVKIQPLGRTQDIYPQAGPDAGRAIARIENLDSSNTEEGFGFRPSRQAEYVFWVDRDPRSKGARLTVLWVPRTGGNVRAGFQKNLTLCHKREAGDTAVSDVDFYEYKHGDSPCTVAGGSNRPSMKEASLLSLRPFAALYESVKGLMSGATIADGAWIDCNSGCCT